MTSESQIKDRLREWLASNQSEIAPSDIADDTHLLEERVLLSIKVPMLLRYIEQLRQRPIEIEDLQPGSFRDIDSIFRAFFDD